MHTAVDAMGLTIWQTSVKVAPAQPGQSNVWLNLGAGMLHLRELLLAGRENAFKSKTGRFSLFQWIPCFCCWNHFHVIHVRSKHHVLKWTWHKVRQGVNSFQLNSLKLCDLLVCFCSILKAVDSQSSLSVHLPSNKRLAKQIMIIMNSTEIMSFTVTSSWSYLRHNIIFSTSSPIDHK